MAVRDTGRKIRERYTDIQNNRRKTILLTLHEFHDLHQNQSAALAMNPQQTVTKPNDSKALTQRGSKVSICICKAIKLNGTPCTSKVFENTPFCKRHSKK